MDIFPVRYAKGDLERLFRLWFAGHILDPPLNLSNVLKIVVEPGPIARRDVFFEKRKLAGYRIEDATGAPPVRKPLLRAGTVTEQALEDHTRIDFCRKRRRGRRPRDGVRISAAVTPVAVAGIVSGIVNPELNGRQ